MHALATIVDDLCNQFVLAPITEQQYRRSVHRFEEFLQKPSVVSDLCVSNVNGYLHWLQNTKNLGATSVSNHRVGLCRVWQHAANMGLCGSPDTRRIRKQPRQKRKVQPWTDNQVAMLIEVAESMPGRLSCGVPANLYLTARLWLGWDTGLRPSDLRILRWSDVDFATQSITITQHKTGNVHTALFGNRSAIAMRNLLRYAEPLVLPASKWAERRWEQILFDRCAKLNGWSPSIRQGLGTLRKCHATAVYRIHGIAAAAESLGHYGSIATARRHYVDSSLHRGYLPPRPAK